MRIHVRNRVPLAIALVLVLSSCGAPATPEDLDRLLAENNLAGAADVAQDLVAVAERKHGAQSLETAQRLDQLAGLLLARDGLGTAESIAVSERAVAIREQLQPGQPDLARSLDTLAKLYGSSGQSGRGVEVQTRAVEIFREHPGEKRLDLAGGILTLGRVQRRNNQWPEALRSFRECLGIYEQAFGPDHPLVARTLQMMIWALPSGDPERLRVAQRSIRILRAHAEENPAALAAGLDSLAAVYDGEGRLVEAADTMAEVIRLTEQIFEPDHYRVAVALNNRGLALLRQGRIAEARPLLERALPIKEQRFGADHLSVAAPLLTLGGIYAEMGDYRKATETLERALRIHEAQPDVNSELAAILISLSMAQLDMGQAEESRVNFERGLATSARIDGEDRAVGTAHMNRAKHLLKRGDFVAAREHAELALPLVTSSIGGESVESATVIGVLGSAFMRSGDLKEGVAKLEEAVFKLDEIPGYDGPNAWELRSELATAYLHAGRHELALDTAIEAEQLARDHFRVSTAVFSEREALQYRTQLVSGTDVALSLFGRDDTSTNPDDATRIFDQLIRSRALVLDEMASRHPAHYGGSDNPLGPLLANLAIARESLARVSMLPVEQPRGQAPEVRQAWNAVEMAERDLAAASEVFRDRLTRFSVGLEEVRRTLPAGSVLVAYKRYRRVAEDASRPDVDSYLAFVQRPGGAAPTVVLLGPAHRIDEQVRIWRSAVATPPPPAPAAARTAETGCNEVGRELRELIWDPIARLVGVPRLVLVVPDADLNLVSFGALPSSSNRYLIEERDFHYLAAERDLARADGGDPGHGLVAVGDPDFDASVGSGQLVAVAQQATGNDLFRGTQSDCGELRQRRFGSLPASRIEVEEIASLWRKKHETEDEDDSILLVGDQATEAAVKTLAPGRRVVHLATHGFVSPVSCGSVSSPRLADGELGETQSLENPLLHSGLVLAGANRRESATTDGSAGVEDGMLTAQEVASLDLSGVEWVVLSACETGVGKVVSGEGVLGLRRAFQVAGAGTVIMSLWEIKDQAAQQWMRAVYDGRLGGLSTAEAVRGGTLSILEGRRKAGATTHPFYWGAFVAAGDWR